MSPEPEPIPDQGGYGPDDSWTLHEALEWHLARVARHETRIHRCDDEHGRMVERHKEWNDRRTAQSREKAFQSRLVIEQLMLAATADPKAPRTVELPSGRVATRKGARIVQVTDFEALRSWSYENNEQVLRWKAEPNVDAIKEAITQGEAVPGVALVDKDRTVTITVGGSDV